MSNLPAIRLEIDPDVPGAAAWAADEVRRAARTRGLTLAEDQGGGGDALVTVVAGLVWGRAGAELAEAGHRLQGAESLSIQWLQKRRLAIVGGDARGLVYALTEVADAIRTAPAATDPLHAIRPRTQRPRLAWRSMQMFLNCQATEERWYFDPHFWDRYLGRLACYRYNNLSLTFNHQNSYLAPPYPFLVELPEFPQVRAPGLDDAARRRNLDMLRHISQTARDRGLHFTLGIWQQHDCGYGEPMVDGLDEEIRSRCNALGLARVLEQCPAIDGLQFRMNYEAGVPEDRQVEFWEEQFRAVAGCGRPIRLDIRAKGLSDRTIQIAREMVPDTVVSTKYWCEHLGMPWHMPIIQRFDVPHYRRYGTWDLWEKPRRTPLVYRLWSFGSQRVLQWGGAEYAARFAASCREGGTGFEVMAPLTNKGGRNETGDWPLITRSGYQPFEFETERYWLFELLFGRLGYDDEEDGRVWGRELDHRLGRASRPVATAIEHASWILPVVTTVFQYSASAWGFWPELWAGQELPAADIRTQPSDPTQFYGIDEYVEAALRGRLDGRWTPFHTADYLDQHARAAEAAIARADMAVGFEPPPEYAGMRLDILVASRLGRYHAARLRALTQMSFFLRTRIPQRVRRAVTAMRVARQHWLHVVQLTQGIYHDDLVFGLRQRQMSGHWQDRLKQVEKELHWFVTQSETASAAESGRRRPRDGAWPGQGARPQCGEATIDLPETLANDQDLCVGLHVPDISGPVSAVLCHVKPALQTLPFVAHPMRSQGGHYRAVVPAAELDPRYAVILLFEIQLEGGEAVRLPDWTSATPYRLVNRED